MACSKQPTSQQLAYLDELKQRLQELRRHQRMFMEETAQILHKMSSVHTSALSANPYLGSQRLVSFAEVDALEDQEGAGNIKQLIQRFEDLSQTSRQFSDQPLPEELAGVDVRRLLKGYEKLIVEGKILQQSWQHLKKTTENCAQHKSGSPTHKDLPSGHLDSAKSSNDWEKYSHGKACCPRFGVVLHSLMRLFQKRSKSKAQRIRWPRPDQPDKTNIRIGK